MKNKKYVDALLKKETNQFSQVLLILIYYRNDYKIIGPKAGYLHTSFDSLTWQAS